MCEVSAQYYKRSVGVNSNSTDGSRVLKRWIFFRAQVFDDALPGSGTIQDPNWISGGTPGFINDAPPSA